MSIIQVSCIDQVLTPTSTPVIASGGIKEDSVAFRFCSQWDGFYKTAVFWRQEQQPYHVILDENNRCVIPAEVLADDGNIYFGVFGVNDDGVQRTSNVLRYTIEKGTITTNTKPSDPTPDVYTQLLAAIAAFGDNTGKADKVTNATAGNLASLDENGNLQDSGRRPGSAGGVATLDSEGKVPSGQLPSMDYIPTSQKAAANGVASLGSDGKVPSGQLPSLDYIPTSQKGVASGVASLDSSGKVPGSQLNLSSSVTSTSTATVATSAAVKTAYDKAVSASDVTTGSGSVVDGGSDRISTILTDSVTWRKFGRIVFVTVRTLIVYSYIGQSGGGVPLSFRVENLPEMETNSCIAIVGSTAVASVESSSFSGYEDTYCGELYNNANYVDVGVLFPAYMHDTSVSNWKANPTGYKFSYTVTIIGFAK